MCLEVDTGPPRTSPMGIESEWLGECHGNGVVSSELPLVHPNGSVRPWVSWCGSSALPLPRVYVYFIDSLVLGHGHGFVLGHTVR